MSLAFQISANIPCGIGVPRGQVQNVKSQGDDTHECKLVSCLNASTPNAEIAFQDHEYRIGMGPADTVLVAHPVAIANVQPPILGQHMPISGADGAVGDRRTTARRLAVGEGQIEIERRHRRQIPAQAERHGGGQLLGIVAARGDRAAQFGIDLAQRQVFAIAQRPGQTGFPARAMGGADGGLQGSGGQVEIASKAKAQPGAVFGIVGSQSGRHPATGQHMVQPGRKTQRIAPAGHGIIIVKGRELQADVGFGHWCKVHPHRCPGVQAPAVEQRRRGRVDIGQATDPGRDAIANRCVLAPGQCRVQPIA